LRRLTGTVLLAAVAVSCSDFLTGKGIDEDPNNPTQATADQLLVSTQVEMFALQNSGIAHFSCIVVQHCTGAGNYLNTWRIHNINPGTFNNIDWSGIYIGSGLIDLRRIQDLSTTLGNFKMRGMAKVIEAMDMSYAADTWGDVPYSDALTSTTPTFDRQEDIYAGLLTLLDGAITDLQGAGDPPAQDLVYRDFTAAERPALWIKAAHSLKARILMHQSEADNSVLNAALTEAGLGIQIEAENFSTTHTEASQERNMWFQFSLTTFGQYLVPAAQLVDSMEARGEAERLAEYFSDVDPGPGTDYQGLSAVTFALPAVTLSTMFTGTRITPTFRQPILSWEETKLIQAEATQRLAAPGSPLTPVATAGPYINAVRTAHGLGLIAAPTLRDIAMEEWVSYFQNIEAWQSYKRHCYPNLSIPNQSNFVNQIPGRVFYGQREENTNPNTPSAATQRAVGGVADDRVDMGGFRNPNDPAGGLVNNAAACIGS
jgi:starch-binding outer membrane protein, SusD/RagB family